MKVVIEGFEAHRGQRPGTSTWDSLSCGIYTFSSSVGNHSGIGERFAAPLNGRSSNDEMGLEITRLLQIRVFVRRSLSVDKKRVPNVRNVRNLSERITLGLIWSSCWERHSRQIHLQDWRFFIKPNSTLSPTSLTIMDAVWNEHLKSPEENWSNVIGSDRKRLQNRLSQRARSTLCTHQGIRKDS